MLHFFTNLGLDPLDPLESQPFEILDPIIYPKYPDPDPHFSWTETKLRVPGLAGGNVTISRN